VCSSDLGLCVGTAFFEEIGYFIGGLPEMRLSQRGEGKITKSVWSVHNNLIWKSQSEW
jgi:hypothetical protein